MRTTRTQVLLLVLLALAIGTTVMTVEAYLDGYLDYLESALGEEWAPMLFRVLLVSLPFLVLAVRGITRPAPWVVGIVLTVLVWGYVVFKFRSGGFEGGTSVGNSMWLALVGFGSSFAITAICAILSRSSQSPSSS
jgi:hypothetical protein